MSKLSNLIEPSARVALAAFLHDLGKFAERAKIDVDKEVLENNQQLYCPHRKGHTDDRGWFSHKHAAYTAIALDAIEPRLPPLKGEDVAPFANWGSDDADDSLINGAAKHHKPDTFLQWIIATADRVASGFERNEFEKYNNADEGTITQKNHYTARQLTLFEQIRLGDKNRQQTYKFRYKLMPLCPNALMPVLAKEYEPTDRTEAQKEYRRLWDGFFKGLEMIPESHKTNLSLWLDHFETLWGCYTHAIPSATAFNARPDVSLYDHSRAVAALAVALWRYHHDRDDDKQKVTRHISSRDDWGEDKLLLIQGDFFGIQNFIFTTGGETQKRAAKLLRGRSFFVSLLTECAALSILDSLGLPATSQIINAAGKFLIVAPNTDEVQKTLRHVQQQIDEWFKRNCWGMSGIGIASIPACCNDFLKGSDMNGGVAPFQNLMKKLFQELENAKLRRFDLCSQTSGSAVFDHFLGQFDDKGVCQIDGHSPAVNIEDNINMSALARDQIKVGEYLTKYKRFFITREDPLHNTLGLSIFGYFVSFTGDEERSGRFSQLASKGDLLRTFDFSLPESGDEELWKGYARRYINGYVPKFNEKDRKNNKKYNEIENEGVTVDTVKSLNHIACEDRQFDENADEWSGICALMTLKGDVDNLGMIFQQGLTSSDFDNNNGRKEGITFAKMAALSRQMNAFFTIYLPYQCQNAYPNTYTVFAGGDDFFLIGPWLSQIKLAKHMRGWFKEYVTGNPDVHFSAGMLMTKPGLPIRYLADKSEHALEHAKKYNRQNCQLSPKNAVNCYGHSVSWDDFEDLIDKVDELQTYSNSIDLSTGYLYGLLQFADMQAKLSEKPENALWHSWFAYRTRRMLERIGGMNEQRKRDWQTRLGTQIADQGIRKYAEAYKITLSTYLYQHRKED